MTGPGSGQSTQVRVLIVDDHPMVRRIVRMACEELAGIEVVGEAADGREAIALFRTLHPNIMVLDLGLPGMSGFDVLRELRQDGSKVRIIVLTGLSARSAVFESLRLGADGFLEKTASIQEMAAAIKAVAEGTHVFSIEHRRAAHAELGELVRRKREAARVAAALTRRESQVLGLIAAGLSTRQIATRIGISERTVETHITHLYEKLGVRNRVRALYEATRLDLIDLSNRPGPEEALPPG